MALLTSLEPTLLLTPGGSHDRNGPVVPALGSGIITVENEGRKGWQLAPDTTNLIPNPRGKNGGQGWSTRTGWVIEEAPDAVEGGVTGWRILNQGATANMLASTQIPETTVAGYVYTFSAKVRITGHIATEGWETLMTARLYDGDEYTDGGNYVRIDLADVDSGGWATIRFTYDPLPPTTSSASRLYLYGASASENATFTILKPQLERRSYASPYCDGDMGSGHAWVGTPHNSASTRVVGYFSVPAVSGTTSSGGSVMMRLRTHANVNNRSVLQLYDSVADSDLVSFSLWAGGGTGPRINWRPGGGSYEYHYYWSAYPLGEFTPHTIYGGWDGSEQTLQLDDAPERVYAMDVPPATPDLPLPINDLYAGSARIDLYEYIFFDRPLTNDERDALTSVPEPWDWSMFEPVPVTTPPVHVPAVPAVAGFATGVVHQHPTDYVTIDGLPVAVDSWTTRHGVDQPVGTAALTIPVRGDVSHIQRNAPVEVQAGYRENATDRIFIGRIADVVRRAGPDGMTLRVQAEDETTRMRYRLEEELVYRGKTTLRDLFASLGTRRGVAMLEAARVLSPNGATEIALGGVPEINGGDVVLRARTSPLTYLAAKANLFGYRVFGKPRGPLALQRVAGTPSGTPVATFAEGVDLFEVENSQSVRDIINYWTVYGARYSDKDGVPIELIAQPVEVPYLPELDPPGYAPGDESDDDLVTQFLVDAVRQTREIDHGAPSELVSWTTWGRPEIQPGDVIAILAPGAGLTTASLRWVLSVTHTRSSRGFTTTFVAWSGGGTPLPGGITEEVITIGAGPYRMGDEYLPHYVIDSGNGNEQAVITFTVPKQYTSLALRGRQHGTNSYLIDGANTEASVSKLEVWQAGERVGSAQLPMSPENLSQALDYTQDRHWTSFRMPIPGQLEPGAAELRIIAGRDNRISDVYALDDFEVKNLELEARGTWRPILPGVR